MADKKRPPHPHGPWPSVFPPDGGRPPRPWPLYPMTPRWNDTEPVIGVRPWEECCDGQDECVCVTSGDVDTWYSVYDTVANNSATWGGASGESGWTASADKWNSTYDTVYDNSAYWTSAAQRADQLDPELLNELSDVLEKSSAFLATYYGLDHVYTKKDVLTGIGTSADPIDLDWKIKVTLDDINDALLQLYKDGDPDQKKNWVHVSALKGVYDWLEEHDALFWKVKPNIPSPYEGDNRKPDGVFDQLEKIWAILRHDGRDIPESANWNSTYITVTNNSARWESSYDTVRNSSGDFYSVYDTVAENSGYWNEASGIIATSADEWNSVYETVKDTSGVWNEGYETAKDLERRSEKWDQAADEIPVIEEKIDDINGKIEDLDSRIDDLEETINERAEVWDDTSDTVAALSGYWDSTHDTVYDNSASWNNASNAIRTSAEKWNSVYETVSDESANWNEAYEKANELESSADKWNQTYEVIDSSSGHWDQIAETVEQNSAAWAKDAFKLQYVENLNYDNYSAYDEPGVIYYNYNKEY